MVGESADDEEMSEAEDQYETDMEDQGETEKKKILPDREWSDSPHSERDPIEELVNMQSDAVCRVMRVNKVVKSGTRAIATPITRGKNDTATKQSVQKLADKIKNLKGVMTNFFTAMGKKEEADEHRWVGLHKAWLNAKDLWGDTLKYIEAVRDIK